MTRGPDYYSPLYYCTTRSEKKFYISSFLMVMRMGLIMLQVMNIISLIAKIRPHWWEPRALGCSFAFFT